MRYEILETNSLVDLVNTVQNAGAAPTATGFNIGSPDTSRSAKISSVLVDIHEPQANRDIPPCHSASESEAIFAPFAVLFAEMDKKHKPSFAPLRATVFAAFSRTGDRQLAEEFLYNMHQFESRLFTDATSQNAERQITNSYDNIRYLLNGLPQEKSLPWRSRCLLAQHFMVHAADPSTISQGSRLAAQVTCLIHKIFLCAPSRAAQILSAVAIESAWTTLDGFRIEIPAGSCAPKREELLYKPGKDTRSYAGQIMQFLLLNNAFQRRAEPLYYTESSGRPGFEYLGQRLHNEAGNTVYEDPILSLLELDFLSRLELGDMNTVVINDLSCAEESIERLDHRRLLVHVSDRLELTAALYRAKREGRLPLSIAVDHRRLMSDSFKDGINHVVNLVDIDEYGTAIIFNPLALPGMKRLFRIGLQRLYNASFSVS